MGCDATGRRTSRGHDKRKQFSVRRSLCSRRMQVMEFEHSFASAAWELRLVESYARGREGIDRQTGRQATTRVPSRTLSICPQRRAKKIDQRRRTQSSETGAIIIGARSIFLRLRLTPPPHTHTRTHARTLQYILRPAAVAQLGGRCRGSSCSPQAQAASAKICTTGEHRKRQSLPNEPKVAYRSKLLPFWLPTRFGTSYSIA